MCWKGLDATIFVERATDFEYRDGLFHVSSHYGDSVIRWVYSPEIFLRSLLGAEQAMAAWQADQVTSAGNVSQLYPAGRLSA
jgi:hypothetical protein